MTEYLGQLNPCKGLFDAILGIKNILILILSDIRTLTEIFRKGAGMFRKFIDEKAKFKFCTEMFPKIFNGRFLLYMTIIVCKYCNFDSVKVLFMIERCSCTNL